jgi:predicted DNA-binding mobile mystery protein A
MTDLATARRHLDQRLGRFRPIEQFRPPPRGWLRAIRDGLGMTTAQLAKRLGRAQSRINALEQAEVSGAVSLKTLAQAAEALDCALVYALVPRRPLEEVVNARARDLAAAHALAAGHSMILEAQGIDAAAKRRMIDDLARRLLTGRASRLWT